MVKDEVMSKSRAKRLAIQAGVPVEAVMIVHALEPKIRALSKKLWDEHPNNPKNKEKAK